jgi:PAS domain S-box-containing protein
MMLGIDDPGISETALCAPRIEQDRGYEDFLRLADPSAAMIWMADNSGLCTFANQSWLEFRGRTLDEEIGTGWAEGIHPDDGLAVLRDYWGAFNRRHSLRIEYRILCADGAYHPVERFGVPWSNPDGEQRGYVGCITLLSGPGLADPEARRRLATLSARERQVIELIALGYSTRQIAEKLGVSYKTADSHRSHLLKKLRVHETASLVRFAVRAGVIAP